MYLFEGIGGVWHFFTSCFILIELVALNSELFTKCKNSKYFSRYREKRIWDLDFWDPLLGLKMAILGVFYCCKTQYTWFLALKPSQKLYSIIVHSNQEVWAIWTILTSVNFDFSESFFHENVNISGKCWNFFRKTKSGRRLKFATDVLYNTILKF